MLFYPSDIPNYGNYLELFYVRYFGYGLKNQKQGRMSVTLSVTERNNINNNSPTNFDNHNYTLHKR